MEICQGHVPRGKVRGTLQEGRYLSTDHKCLAPTSQFFKVKYAFSGQSLIFLTVFAHNTPQTVMYLQTVYGSYSSKYMSSNLYIMWRNNKTLQQTFEAEHLNLIYCLNSNAQPNALAINVYFITKILFEAHCIGILKRLIAIQCLDKFTGHLKCQ